MPRPNRYPCITAYLLAVFIGVCCDASEPATEAVLANSSEQLQAWATQLDARKFAEREQATELLLGAGAAAIPKLEEILAGESLEAADRAVWILQKLSENADPPVQLAALEALVTSKRFPGVVHQASLALAELYEEMCRENLEMLGAEFTVSTEHRGLFEGGVAVKVNANREEWLGSNADLLQLVRLREISVLRVAAKSLENQQVKQLAGIEGLEVLELIETQATPEVITEIKKLHPGLRVRLKSRAMLGIALTDGGVPTIIQVHANTPAAKAGFKAQDVVLSLAGEKVATFDELTTRISQFEPGDKVEIEVLRGAETVTLTATLIGADWTAENPLGSP